MDPSSGAGEEQKGSFSDSERTALAWVLGAGVGVLVLIALAVSYTIGFNRGKDEARPSTTAQPAEAPAQPAPVAGPSRDLFASSCGSCHTLEAAGTSGTVGPNLDDLAPDEQQVLAAIQNGGTGSGVMPAGLLQGKQATDVAAFVTASAGG